MLIDKLAPRTICLPLTSHVTFMLTVENTFCLLVSLALLDAGQLFRAQQEECGTFEPLHQPFSFLIVVSWQEIRVHWFRTPAGSLHKSQTGCIACSDNAAHRGEADRAGWPGFMRGVYGSTLLPAKFLP